MNTQAGLLEAIEQARQMFNAGEWSLGVCLQKCHAAGRLAGLREAAEKNCATLPRAVVGEPTMGHLQTVGQSNSHIEIKCSECGRLFLHKITGRRATCSPECCHLRRVRVAREVAAIREQIAEQGGEAEQ